MGYDERTAERVRRILAGRGDVVEQRMIGGLSFMVGGGMCCGVTRDGLMVRVGSGEAYERALAEPHVRPMELGGRRLAAFVLVAPEGYATDAELAAWVRRGLDFAATLPGEKPAGAPRGPRPEGRG